MTKIFLCIRAALMSAALLSTGAHAAGQAPKAGDPCFKRVFDKTASTGRWVVKECVKEMDIYFDVDFRDGQLRQHASVVKTNADEMDAENNAFTVVAGDSLVIDIPSERGGHVIAIHPVNATKELSSVDVHYMNPDEGGKFNLKRSGNTISLKTNFDDIAIAIDPDGRLKNVTRPAKASPAPHK